MRLQLNLLASTVFIKSVYSLPARPKQNENAEIG